MAFIYWTISVQMKRRLGKTVILYDRRILRIQYDQCSHFMKSWKNLGYCIYNHKVSKISGINIEEIFHII